MRPLVYWLFTLFLLSGSWLTLEGNYLNENEESKPVEFPPQGSLTPQLIQYYSAVVGVILGNSEQMLQVTFYSLSKLSSFDSFGLMVLYIESLGQSYKTFRRLTQLS